MNFDFDIFTNEINITRSSCKDIYKRLVYNAPSTPNSFNYQSGRKVLAVEFLADNDEAQCAFNFSEAVSGSIRTAAIYRDEQREMAADTVVKIPNLMKPEQDIIKANPISTEDSELLDRLVNDADDVESVTRQMKNCQLDQEPPLHRRYLKFTKENNVDNFLKILKELPEEWTVVQLTAPYNPEKNFKLLKEYQTQMDSIYLSVFTNDYMTECDVGPFTVNIPANVTKEGMKPLFVELHSILEENYKILEKAQFLNSKKLVKNYWYRREEVDLRMKSLINMMDAQWLGGWGALLTGRLLDRTLKTKVVKVVNDAIADWGFIKLTNKQKILLYNLMESCNYMNSQQIKSCIRKILTENGNIDDIRQALNPCVNCTKEFTLVNEVCLTCLSSCFERMHHFSLLDGIRAFSQVAAVIKDSDEFAPLKNAERNPVILIVDEMLDTFPWEALPALSAHPVSRVENVHFLYHLYRLHARRVAGAYFTTGGHDGRYVINPERNLERMQRRMQSFVQYWCGAWRGHVAEPPAPDLFRQYLTGADIFLYCGHGDGCQFAADGAGAGVEAARGARAVCVLAGCGSARLAHAAGRVAPHAAHRKLHVAGCPSVIGMLWEVTDLEVDKVVSSLLALAVPSDARPPWHALGKDNWSQGLLDTKVESAGPYPREAELLRAVVRSRGSSNYVMIGSSVVARGLPVRIR